MSYGSEGLSLETMKVDLEGNLLWSNKYPDSSFVYHMPNAIDVTEENNLVITGQSYYYDSNHLPFPPVSFCLKQIPLETNCGIRIMARPSLQILLNGLYLNSERILLQPWMAVI